MTYKNSFFFFQCNLSWVRLEMMKVMQVRGEKNACTQFCMISGSQYTRLNPVQIPKFLKYVKKIHSELQYQLSGITKFQNTSSLNLTSPLTVQIQIPPLPLIFSIFVDFYCQSPTMFFLCILYQYTSIKNNLKVKPNKIEQNALFIVKLIFLQCWYQKDCFLYF